MLKFHLQINYSQFVKVYDLDNVKCENILICEGLGCQRPTLVSLYMFYIKEWCKIIIENKHDFKNMDGWSFY